MLLSDITNKPLYLNDTFKGVCKGVGISLKTYAVKYLICSTTPQGTADFCINFSAVEYVDEHSVAVSRLRPVFPKSCAKLWISLPVFTADGAFLGALSDLELLSSNDVFTAGTLFTDKNGAYPSASISACADALLLRKTPTYPIGQRIHTPVVLPSSPLVTKGVLRKSIKNNALIKLTLSLPPFSIRLS